MRICKICRWRSAVAKERCKACHEYRRRTGRDRDQKLVLSHARRVFDRRTA